MDTLDDIAANRSPLEQRRAELRALYDDIMDAIKLLPKPQSWLEGDRAMRCLATSDRTVVQLFNKVRAHAPASRPADPSAPREPVQPYVPVSPPEPPFVYRFDDEDDDIPANDTSETAPDADDGGKALDSALDDMEAMLDAFERGDIPAPNTSPKSLPPSPSPASTNSQSGYHQMTEYLTRSRDLFIELATDAAKTPSAPDDPGDLPHLRHVSAAKRMLADLHPPP